MKAAFFHGREDIRIESVPRPRPGPGEILCRNEVALTCGTAEENRANNRVLAESLAAQGYAAWYADIRDAHNWTCWRDSFDPHLPALIEAAT